MLSLRLHWPGPEWVEVRSVQSFLQVFTAMRLGLGGCRAVGLRRCAQRSLDTCVYGCQHTDILLFFFFFFTFFLTFRFKQLCCKEREKNSVSVALAQVQNWHHPPSHLGAGPPTHPLSTVLPQSQNILGPWGISCKAEFLVPKDLRRD